MKRVPAFTLLELLIVITIIGILTSVLIVNFVGVRQRQELTLMADQVVAMLQQARGEVSSGKVKSETASDGTTTVNFLCEGSYFELESAPIFVTTVYDLDTGTCDTASLETELYGLSTGNAHTDELTVDEISQESLYVLYAPPEANVLVYDGNFNLLTGDVYAHFDNSPALDLDLSISVSASTNLVTLSLGNEE